MFPIYMFWGGRIRWSVFSQVGKHPFAYLAHKELRRLWRQIPTKIGKPQPSSVMRRLTTPISTVHLCIDPNLNRSFCRLRVARVRCESAIYSWMIHQVSQVFHSYHGNDSQIVLPNYRQVYCYPLITVSHILIHHSLLSITLWLPVIGRPIYPPQPCWLVTRQLPAPALAWASCMVSLSCVWIW